MSIDGYPQIQAEMADPLRETLAGYSAESVSLRLGAQPLGADSSTGELLDLLLDVRGRLDRMEELLATTLQLRGLAARKHTALRIQVDDSWDEVAVRLRQSAVRDEFSSAKERAAVVNVEVLDLRRLERVADTQARCCEETVEQIRLRLRGLQEVRQDLLAVIKVRQFESTLER